MAEREFPLSVSSFKYQSSYHEDDNCSATGYVIEYHEVDGKRCSGSNSIYQETNLDPHPEDNYLMICTCCFCDQQGLVEVIDSRGGFYD